MRRSVSPRLQVARLVKALRLAEAAVELGELKAVATYLRVVAALDRYHELAAGPPPPRRAPEAPPLALPAPPKALTFAAPPAGDEPSTVGEMSDPADDINSYNCYKWSRAAATPKQFAVAEKEA